MFKLSFTVAALTAVCHARPTLDAARSRMDTLVSNLGLKQEEPAVDLKLD